MTAPISSQTVPALSNALKALLTRAGVENPEGDAREILCAVLNCSRMELISRNDTLSEEASEKAIAMARRRITGEPIQYIIGSWSFMGRDYKVGEGVLIPRDDTEVVVNEALRMIRGKKAPRVIDLCSGTGVIAITMERELKNASVFAVEKSPEACAYLRTNAADHRSAVTIIEGDLFDCHTQFEDGSLDLIVSNPPYIRSGEINALQREVQFEPRMALDGGESGYDFYEAIIRLWTSKLQAGGFIALEIGEDQFETIKELLKAHGYTAIKGYFDIQGSTRAVTACRTPFAE